MRVKDVRDMVRRRDGDGCLLCNVMRPLHLHRVKYASQGGVYETTNCCFLCPDCHRLVHADKPRYQPLLEQHIKDHPPLEF